VGGDDPSSTTHIASSSTVSRKSSQSPVHQGVFLPPGLLLFEPVTRGDLNLFMRLFNAKRLLVELPPSTVARTVTLMRHLWHERAHYEHYTTTALALLLLRLRAIQRDAATDALNDAIRTRPLMHSLTSLIWANEVTSDTSGADATLLRFARPTGFSSRGFAAMQSWIAANDLEALLLGSRATRRYLRICWEKIFGVPSRCFMPSETPMMTLSCNIVAAGSDEDTLVDADTSARELLEGAARLAEINSLVKIVGVDETRRMLANDRNRVNLVTVLRAASRLRLAITHPIIRALHDLALQQMPDPELLVGSDVTRLDWDLHYPGRFFDRALKTLETTAIPSPMTESEAYEFLDSQLPAAEIKPYHAMRGMLNRLPSVEKMLDERQAVSTRSFALAFHASYQTLVDEFARKTIAAALRLRRDHRTVFIDWTEEAPPTALALRNQLRCPPFVVTPGGLDAYECVNAGGNEHLALLADAIREVAIDELASWGTCGWAQIAVRAGARTYGESFPRAVVGTICDRLPDHLASYVASELPPS
jgi:hypothetical protein